MKTLSIFGIIFSLICLGCSIFMMNAECNCPPAENASLFFNNTEPTGAFGSGLISLFVSIFFLTFSIITAVIFLGSKKATTASWPAANMAQPQPQPQQPQPNYNWQNTNYPPPAQNQQWSPTPPPQTPPANPQWTPQAPPPPPQNQQWNQPPPPPPGWQQPPANDDVNRWAPKRDNPPNNTPPAN